MVDSSVVLNGQTIAYSIYAVAIIVLMLGFGYKITREGKSNLLKASLFYTLVGALVFLGVSLHLASNQTIPWVAIDLNRDNITPSQTFDISMEDHTFFLPEEKMVMNVGDTVVFDVVSHDVTYGFGIFRQDGSMVSQMQVVPGHRNDLMWSFVKPGIYSIRSTEYSGPAGHKMVVKDVIEVK